MPLSDDDSKTLSSRCSDGSVISYDAYFYESVRRKFVETSDWHPVNGEDYYRPLYITQMQFQRMCEEEGDDWIRWEVVKNACPSLEEMMEHLEFQGFRFVVRDGLTEFGENPDFEIIETQTQIMKMSRNGVFSSVFCYPVLRGILFDKRLKEKNARRAIEFVRRGMRVKDAQRCCRTSARSMSEFGYPLKKRNLVETLHRVRTAKNRIESGEKVNVVLREMNLGQKTYYEKRKGV